MGHTQNKPASPGDILHIANIASARLCKILANDPNFTTEKSDAILRKKGGRKEIHDLVDELAERFIGIHLNPYLKLNHRDDEATAYEMYGPNACFEELFGSLCGHIKQDDVNGIPVLVKKLKEHNLVFSSKKAGVDCITSGVESGVYKKGFIYFFAYFDEDGNIFVAGVSVDSDGGVHVRVDRLSCDDRWDAGFAHRLVVPATKTLEAKS